jgi:DNA-binding CsgD family transcriptional regulator
MAVSPLLERDELLAELERMLEQARVGIGAMALIAGEAGAGKTTLIRALEERAGENTVVLHGHCDPLVTPRALSPLHDIAANREAGLSGLMSGELDLSEIFDTVMNKLRATLRPVLMVIEDIHWADEATLDLLRFVGRRVEGSKALVTCTYRDDEIGHDHPLRSTLGHLTPLASTRTLHIPPLSETAVKQLIGDRPLDAPRLHDLTGGNAFFVTEVIAGGGKMPGSVRDAVITRVQRLDAAPRKVAEVVSVAPRSLEIDRAILLSESEADAVDQAVSSGVVILESGQLRFRHELARAAVEEEMPPLRRLELHGRMLALLEREGSKDLARLAHHAVRAGQGRKVVEYAPAAAKEASRRASPREAISLLRAALAHTDMLSGDQTADLRIDLAYELAQVDDPEGSLVEARLAADHFRSGARPERLAAALDRVAIGLWRLKDIPGANRAVNEALAMLEPLGPSPELAYSQYMVAYHHMLARHAGEARAAIAKARTVAQEVNAPETQQAVTIMDGTIEIVLGDARRGAEILRSAADQAEREGNTRAVTIALGMLGSGAGEARLYQDALPAIEKGVNLAIARDNDYQLGYLRAWGARIAFEQGRWDDATHQAAVVDKTAIDRQGIGIITALGALGRVRVRRGDPGALEVLEPIAAAQADYEIQHVWSPIAGLAEHHWLRGETAEMRAVLEDGYQRALDTDSVWARGELGYWMWLAGGIESPPDRSAEPFALQMAGRWREAAGAWQEIGCPYEVGLSLMEGDQEAVLEAIAIFDDLGARPIAAVARSKLRDLGVDRIPRGPSAETRANPAGLTTRQLEVLELMGEGLTNPEIAERLYISAKTVEHHVSAIFTKLGVTTRAKAVMEGERIGAIDSAV